MKQYLDLLRHVLENGEERGDRTGTGTISYFGAQLRFNLADGFPLVTTKKVFLRGLIEEMLWMIAGRTDAEYLEQRRIHIWYAWKQCTADDLVLVKQRTSKYELADTIDYDAVLKSANRQGHRLAPTWKNMIDRCYKPGAENPRYGKVGVKVAKRWLSFAQFCKDVERLPGWHNKCSDWNNVELDKDYYLANCYAPDVCTWQKQKDNAQMRAMTQPVLVIGPNGHRQTFASVLDAAAKLHVHYMLLFRHLNKGKIGRYTQRNKSYNYIEGWTITSLTANQGYAWRKPLILDNYGPIYGKQWRSFTTIDYKTKQPIVVDQLQDAIDDIIYNRESRRIIVNAWHPGQLDDMALPPCHMFFQFYVHTDDRLDLLLYCRSQDLLLGTPFNIAQYAALLMMVAKITGKTPGTLVYTAGDAHIYSNHVEHVKEQLSREPYPLPKLVIHGNQEYIEDFKFEDFELIDYQCHPAIKAPVAV